MPILEAEPELFPQHLFDPANRPESFPDRSWWVLHTRPRQEKSLARELCRHQIAFYLPLVSRRSRVRNRILTSHVPLFPGYVFLLGNREERLLALSRHRVARSLPVVDRDGLWHDLRQINRLIAAGAPLALEDRLTPGTRVEISSGPLAGLKGKIVRAASGRRFVVEVDFIQQGASVLLDDFALTRIV